MASKVRAGLFWGRKDPIGAGYAGIEVQGGHDRVRREGGLIWAKSALRPSFVLPWPHSYSPAIVHALPLFLLPYASPTAPAADAAPFIAPWPSLPLLPLPVRVRAPSSCSQAIVRPLWPSFVPPGPHLYSPAASSTSRALGLCLFTLVCTSCCHSCCSCGCAYLRPGVGP